jgi:hypothetical protein
VPLAVLAARVGRAALWAPTRAAAGRRHVSCDTLLLNLEVSS